MHSVGLHIQTCCICLTRDVLVVCDSESLNLKEYLHLDCDWNLVIQK